MKVLLVASLIGLIASPVLSYENLGEAFQATLPSCGRVQLREDAVQYIVEECRLGWTTGWPTTYLRHWTDVRAYVSPNRHYCLLSKAGASEWGQGGVAEYCLVGVDSGSIWLRQGMIADEPRVSDSGMVALFQDWKSPSESRNGYIELLIINVDEDTLFTLRWSNHIARPLQRTRLSEIYGFSQGGRYFIVTMNVANRDEHLARASEYNNTMLHSFDLREESERVEDLGAFWPKGLEMTENGVTLAGEWREGLSTVGTVDGGFYRVTWSPWRVERVVTQTFDWGNLGQ